MWTFVLFLAVIGLVVWLFLRPNPNTPAVTVQVPPDADWFARTLIKFTGAWSSHGHTWKRWLCFIAGIGVGLLAPAAIAFLTKG